jgi:hypothetical protein
MKLAKSRQIVPKQRPAECPMGMIAGSMRYGCPSLSLVSVANVPHVLRLTLDAAARSLAEPTDRICKTAIRQLVALPAGTTSL